MTLIEKIKKKMEMLAGNIETLEDAFLDVKSEVELSRIHMEELQVLVEELEGESSE